MTGRKTMNRNQGEPIGLLEPPEGPPGGAAGTPCAGAGASSPRPGAGGTA
jgi:hypothetical protein